jgi:hypothetical protein
MVNAWIVQIPQLGLLQLKPLFTPLIAPLQQKGRTRPAASLPTLSAGNSS